MVITEADLENLDLIRATRAMVRKRRPHLIRPRRRPWRPRRPRRAWRRVRPRRVRKGPIRIAPALPGHVMHPAWMAYARVPCPGAKVIGPPTNMRARLMAKAFRRRGWGIMTTGSPVGRMMYACPPGMMRPVVPRPEMPPVPMMHRVPKRHHLLRPGMPTAEMAPVEAEEMASIF